MFKRMFVLVLMMVLLLVPTGVAFADGPPNDPGPPPDCGQGSAGFDDLGFNHCANIFVGDAIWGGSGYENDHSVIKWNRAGDALFSEGGDLTGAWAIINWNGRKSGGSGETWHAKVEYTNCPTPGEDNCIWGGFELTQSHSTDDNGHTWEVPATNNH